MTQRCDYDLISLYSITAELNIKIMRIKEMITNLHLRKCIENSIENLHIDVGVCF